MLSYCDLPLTDLTTRRCRHDILADHLEFLTGVDMIDLVQLFGVDLICILTIIPTEAGFSGAAASLLTILPVLVVIHAESRMGNLMEGSI